MFQTFMTRIWRRHHLASAANDLDRTSADKFPAGEKKPPSKKNREISRCPAGGAPLACLSSAFRRRIATRPMMPDTLTHRAYPGRPSRPANDNDAKSKR